MNVLLIHEHGRSFGSGGVIAMYRLHRSLQRQGVTSTIACRKRSLEGDDIVELPRAEFLEDWLGKITWRLGLNDLHCVSSFKIPRFGAFQQADVVNIHGLHSNFFNYMALPKLGRLKPLVLTFHDMWNLTGHCAQSYDCQRWRIGCGHCPYLNAFPPVKRDATAIEWKLKNWSYKRTPMTIVAPSRWLIDQIQHSMLDGFPIHHIPNAVDTELFKPLDRAQCRSKLGLPPDKLVIMFASAALNDPMKGGPLLLEALQGLSESLKSQIVLLLLGDRGEEMAKASGIATVGLGYIKEDQPKVQAYCAADIFVLPSRAENHSLVLLEALACGTPCVAFNVGGNPEIVRPGLTGYLAKPDNPEDLRHGIVELLENPSMRRAISDRCRQIALDEFSLKLHTQRYMDLYEMVQAERASSRGGAAGMALPIMPQNVPEPSLPDTAAARLHS